MSVPDRKPVPSHPAAVRQYKLLLQGEIDLWIAAFSDPADSSRAAITCLRTPLLMVE